MGIYYFSNQIYQLSYALPFYYQLGGTFIVNSISKYFRFKKHLSGLATFGEKTLFNTPSIIIKKNKDFTDLEGVILSFSNSFFNVDKEKCKTIFHEHGASDKRIGSNPNAKTKEKLLNFDYIFLMSPKNLIKINALNLQIPKGRLIKIYNQRFEVYKNNLENKKEILKKRKINPNRKTVLYAPTWRFGSGSLHKYFFYFAKEITKEYNLIVRPHFHESKYIIPYSIKAKLAGIKNLYFSNPSNISKYDTMMDFAISDILISDTSAVLYEYLVTKNPIIIVDVNYKKLVKMPKELDIMQNALIFKNGDDILRIIRKGFEQKELFEDKYGKMFANTFYLQNQNDVKNPITFIKDLL